MHDTLKYFAVDPIHRSHHQSNLTFGLLYAFTERFILPLSHDEVVHGKKSLLSKMPGDLWQQFAGVRLLYSYMIGHVGKKLLFMGGEIGQWSEWNFAGEIDWKLLDFPLHRGLKRMVATINQLYQAHPALWERDHTSEGFSWIDFSDAKNSVISYLRIGDAERLVCVHNFTPTTFTRYFIRLSGVSRIREIFSSDREEFGGSGKMNEAPEPALDERGNVCGFNIVLAPLATMMFEVE
jgi:1,4-alpha-glucan branching enzyme